MLSFVVAVCYSSLFAACCCLGCLLFANDCSCLMFAVCCCLSLCVASCLELFDVCNLLCIVVRCELFVVVC